MRALIRWATRNPQAMNTIMLVVMVIGVFSFGNMRRESFPEFDLEIILVSVPYPGASPEEVEEGICQKIEEAIRSVTGIKKKTSVSREGVGYLILELDPSIKKVQEVQKVLSEIRSEVDRIPSFPELAENRDISQITMRMPAIRVAVIGPAGAGDGSIRSGLGEPGSVAEISANAGSRNRRRVAADDMMARPVLKRGRPAAEFVRNPTRRVCGAVVVAGVSGSLT